MKVLVTGASGFVGTAVCRVLEMRNIELVRLGKFRSEIVTEAANRKSLSMDFFADVCSQRQLAELENLPNISAVVHCAGLAHQFKDIREEEFFKVNVEGTQNIINLAAKLKIERFVLISSAAVYGETSGSQIKIVEETNCQPKSFYARSKLESEKTALVMCQKNDINLTILRPSTVIGEGDRGNLDRLIRVIDSGKYFRIGNGKNKKSFLYKDDLGRACAEIIQKSVVQREILNVSAEPISVAEVIAVIEKILQANRRRISIPSAPLMFASRLNRKTVKLKFIENKFQILDKWLSEDQYSAEKFRRDYNFAIQVSAVESVRRECLDYLANKC